MTGNTVARSLRKPFQAASQRLVDAIRDVFKRQKLPLTVRQVYYQLATLGLVPLSHPGYRQAQRLLLRVREEGIIPWGDFADRGRERIKPSAWGDASDFAHTIAGAYRKDLWQAQPDHVEFWLEKDALSAFVADALRQWGNPLCVVRGFSSGTFVHECAAFLNAINKPKYIYYLGDHDPSGLSIERNIQERLTEFGANFTFERLAITLDDIKAYDLRPLVAKKSDSRYERYVAEHGTATVELDALPPDVLRARIQAAVRRHIDQDEWERLRRVERVETASIRGLAARLASLPTAPRDI